MRMKDLANRRFLKRVGYSSRGSKTLKEVSPFGPMDIDPPEVVSLRKQTMADKKREKAMSRVPQLEKDLADFNFKGISNGNKSES